MSKNKMARIKPVMAIICDDIRTEDNGKPMILGIYRGKIKVNLPAEDAKVKLFLSLWMPFEVLKLGDIVIEVKITGPGPERQFEMKANASFDKIPPEYEIPSFNFIGFPVFIEDGNLEIFYRHKGDSKWIKLRTVPIVKKIMDVNK